MKTKAVKFTVKKMKTLSKVNIAFDNLISTNIENEISFRVIQSVSFWDCSLLN